jgi:integrase
VEQARRFVGVAAGDRLEALIRVALFASTVGTLMEPRNVTRRVQQLRGRANLPTLRLHDFRHACALRATPWTN